MLSYRVFDANPNDSDGNEWPQKYLPAVESAERVDDAIREHVLGDPEYPPGTRVWVQIESPDGDTRTIVVAI